MRVIFEVASFVLLRIATGCTVGETVLAQWPDDNSWREVTIREVIEGGDCGIYRVNWHHSDICVDTHSEHWGESTSHIGLQSQRCRKSRSQLKGGSCGSVTCKKQGFGGPTGEEEEEGGMPTYLIAIIVVSCVITGCFCMYMVVQCAAKDGEELGEGGEVADNGQTPKSNGQGLWSMKTSKSIGNLGRKMTRGFTNTKLGGKVSGLARSMSFKKGRSSSRYSSSGQKVSPAQGDEEQGEHHHHHHHHHKRESEANGEEHHHHHHHRSSSDLNGQNGHRESHHPRHSSSNLNGENGHRESHAHHHRSSSKLNGENGHRESVAQNGHRESKAGQETRASTVAVPRASNAGQENSRHKQSHRASSRSEAAQATAAMMSGHPQPPPDVNSPPQPDIAHPGNGHHGHGKHRHSHR
eukprot:gnl/MRDRNA2_/MRDRNA2_62734_c0_seq1.p1 gnl/MRDRNA2_/MRDRNA2_62734_c0~~gnl/MRDRNA2_/MRDRNA2_62734_c0_seq1.p1  ORF type:complete len:410 (-),score=45.15 gnl/MRDRNA2_/MRDRNA2_62734_c0_seq1:108-1337(-)